MTQGDVFLKGEGDAYFQRNADHLAQYCAGDDPIARALSSLDIQPKRILDLGCSSGQRLGSLCKYYRATGRGVDPSDQALLEASRNNPGIVFEQSTIDKASWECGHSDLIICSFVLHWVPRETLLRSLAKIEQFLTPTGYVVIFDFYPLTPHKRAYHHKPGVWTFKADYAGMLTSTGCYEIKYRKALTYPGYQVPEQGYTGDLCAVTVLQRVPVERMPVQ